MNRAGGPVSTRTPCDLHFNWLVIIPTLRLCRRVCRALPDARYHLPTSDDPCLAQYP